MNPQNALSMLVVEDSDEDFDTVMEAVRISGIPADVPRAVNGDECLAMLSGAAAIRPALILMDLNTPGTDGRDALQAIKADPVLKTCPVVVLSTSANPRDLEFCKNVGADAYHVKPVRYPDHLQLLIDLINSWLSRDERSDSRGTIR